MNVENHTLTSFSVSSWNWPSIPGLDEFQGKKVHSASWDHDYDYSKKRIAVIGNGSSGIQILPQMAKIEGTQVTSFQRGPTWVVSTMNPASLLGKQDPAYNPAYTEKDKAMFREMPEKHNEYRKKIIHSINDSFKMVCEKSVTMIGNYANDAAVCEKFST